MSYGLKIINPSNELVVSSDANGLYCIGKATLQGSVVQPSGTATTSGGRQWGYSVYRISHSGSIVPALDLPLNKTVGVHSVTQPSAGVWDITVYCGDSPDANGFDTQYQLDVWAFGIPSTILGTVGLALYNSSGGLAYDFSRPNLLFPRAYVSGANYSSVTIPSLTRPVVIGCPTSDLQGRYYLTINSAYSHWLRWGWKRTSSTSMTQASTTRFHNETFGPDQELGETNDAYATPAFLIEGSTLP